MKHSIRLIAFMICLFACVDIVSAVEATGRHWDATAPKHRTAVISIFLDKIEGDYVYSEDGQKYKLSPKTSIKHGRVKSKKKIAVLHFEGDVLESVTIK